MRVPARRGTGGAASAVQGRGGAATLSYGSILGMSTLCFRGIETFFIILVYLFLTVCPQPNNASCESVVFHFSVSRSI